MSYYGTPRAVMTPYGDILCCLECATIVQLYRNGREDVYEFLRERAEQYRNAIGQEEIDDFVKLVEKKQVPSWLGSREPMQLLLEGQQPDQSMLDDFSCACCHHPLREKCVDY